MYLLCCVYVLQSLCVVFIDKAKFEDIYTQYSYNICIPLCQRIYSLVHLHVQTLLDEFVF